MSGSEGRAYAVVGVPSTEAYKRLNKVMKALRSNLGGPKFDPHLTITGPINLTREDAIKKFREACKGLKAYPAHSQAISAGDSYWQSIFVLLHSTAQVIFFFFILIYLGGIVNMLKINLFIVVYF